MGSCSTSSWRKEFSPIFPPERIFETRPDYVLVLPWNLKTEIMTQMATIRDWGGQFVLPIPEVKIEL